MSNLPLVRFPNVFIMKTIRTHPKTGVVSEELNMVQYSDSESVEVYGQSVLDRLMSGESVVTYQDGFSQDTVVCASALAIDVLTK